MFKSRLYIFIKLDKNKYYSEICSLDITQKHRMCVPKTLPSNKNTLETRN